MTENSISQPATGIFARLGRGLGRLRDWISNLFFFFLLLILLSIVLSSCQRIEVPQDAALVLNPAGSIVDVKSSVDPLSMLLRPQSTIAEADLPSLLLAIETATTDDRIKQLVLRLDDLSYVSTAHAKTLGAAIERFRTAGKSVVTYGYYFDQPQYLLASFADAVYMHPMGQVFFTGSGSFSLYFKQLLDYLKINVNIFRVGQYKSFVEPYERTDMSESARTANRELTNGLWAQYSAAVAANRRLEVVDINDYLEGIATQVQTVKGDMARLALESHLIDELLTEDQARARVADTVGINEESGEINGIDYQSYLAATNAQLDSNAQPYVSVITARGQIMMDRSLPASIGADHLTQLIRQAKKDPSSRALVLRVDSPGGSAFASELIRAELELYQLTARPVVISMGNVAASGGYWISATSDHIVAEPSTITGSIGIFGIIPTLENSLEAIGITSDGVGVGPLSGTGSLTRGVNPALSTVMQAGIEHGYDQFLTLVARGRSMSIEAVDEVAQGRVWLGTQALELGLVDSLGNLESAIAQAAELAGLEQNNRRHVTPPVSPRDQLLRMLADTGQAQGAPVPTAASFIAQINQWWQENGGWSGWDDPRNQYVLCLRCGRL